jgi:kynurenine formamidase
MNNKFLINWLIFAVSVSLAFFFVRNVMNKSRFDKKVIDLTHVFSQNISVSSYDETPQLEKIKTLQKDGYNNWRLTVGMHTGTHIDGPGHLTDSKLLMSDISIDKFVGAGYLVDARGKSAVTADLLTNMPTTPGLIVLVLTGCDKKFGTKEYFTDYPVLDDGFVQELIKRKVKMVGLDCFSPDKYPFATHRLLFAHDMLIIENLTGLEQLVGVKQFDVVALPLKLTADSSPARVIALV